MRTIDSFGKRFFLLRLLDWEIWTAGLVSDTNARDMFVSAVAKYTGDQEGSSPLRDWYKTTNGSDEAFKARPVVGGHLALVSRSSFTCFVGISSDFVL